MSKPVELRRGLSVSAAIAINVANMIGTGVFLKSRVMTCNVGTGYGVLSVWLAAGLLSLAGTFAYSELGAMLPHAGGDYVYLRRAYGRFVAFLYGWTNFMVAKAASQAALAVGMAIFLNVALGGALGASSWHAQLLGVGFDVTALTVVALSAIWVVALINCASVVTGGRMALVLTVIKVLLVAGVAAVAFIWGRGDFSHLMDSGAAGSCEGVAATARGGLAGFGAAMLGALWAYDGWNNAAPLIGELKDPQANASRTFIGGMLVVGALYLLVNLGYFYVLTPLEVASVPATSSVATVVLTRFFGPLAVSLTAVALMVSSLGSLHASVLANSRVPYAMARDGLFFKGLAKLSNHHVPVRAIMAQAIWGSVLALSGSYDTLTDSVIFASWLFYGLSTAAVFVFRVREPQLHRPYRALGYPWVSIVFLLVTGALLINTFVATPRQALQGCLMILLGLPFYAFWTRKSAA